MSENFENVAENINSENTTSTSQTVSTSQTNAPTSSTIDSSILAQFAFTKDKKIPVYPYVVALTGHREANLTEEVKKMATRQLRALSKAWDAKSGRTAPLIALVGLSGESELFWIDTAVKLRDEEKRNIKVVAVTSMPYKYVKQLAKEKNIEILKEIDKRVQKVDDVIECPIEEDVKEYLQTFDDLQNLLTGSQEAQNDLFGILMQESKTLLDMQYHAFRKFMCLHSHVLIALVKNDESWKTANIAGVNIESLDFGSAKKPDINFVPYEQKREAQKRLEKFKCQIETLQLQQDNFSNNPSELMSTFRSLAGNLFPKVEKEIQRTDAMIFYKLLGNVDSALRENNNDNNGITFTSIGPVVCIQTENPSKDRPWFKYFAKNFYVPAVSILVKDRPDDNQFNITVKDSWRSWRAWFLKGFKSIANYTEIKDVIEQLGQLNKTIVKGQVWIKREKFYKTSEDFFTTENANLPPNDQVKLDTPSIDPELDSLIRHFNYADQLAIRYHKRTKWCIWLYCAFLFIYCFFFCIIGIISEPDPDSKTENVSVSESDPDLKAETVSVSTPVPNLKAENVSASEPVPDLKIAKSILLFSFFVIGCVCIYAWWFKPHKYYHNFRALAEALRIQIFWRLATMHEAVPGNFRLHQLECISWLRVALNGLDCTLKSVSETTFNQKYINYQWIDKLWINSQLQYLTGKKKGERYNVKEGELRNYRQSTTIDDLEKKMKSMTPLKRRLRIILLILGILFSGVLSSGSNTDEKWITALGIAFLLVILYFAYKVSRTFYFKLSLAELDLKQKQQQLYPFRRVQLLLSVRLAYWQKARENLGVARENFESKPLDANMLRSLSDQTEDCVQTTIIKAHQENQKLLHQLGQITLNINADWLMGADDRKFILPR